MNVKNWSFSYKGKGKQEVKQHILDTFSLWGAMGLLWYSFFSIIKEHFLEISEVDGVIIGVFLCVLWLGYDWPKTYLKKFALPCHLAGVAIPIAYVLVNFENIVDGVVRLAEVYLPKWNDYYKQNLYMGIASDNENAVLAFTAMCMICWWLVWALAYVLKKRIVLVLFPVIALSLELVVGLSPKENGLFYALFGAMLLTTLGGSSVVKKAVVLACVWLCVSLSGNIFEENIKELATTQKKQEILQLQKNFNIKEFNLTKLFQIDFHFNWEKLGNNAPQFSGKTVLEIKSQKPPIATVYMKGFYATNYDGGNWSYDDSAFRAACKEAGKSTEEVAKQLFQMPYDRWSKHYNNSVLDNKITYEIIYTGTTGDVAYVPYVSDYASLDEEYALMGDFLLEKSIWDTSITATTFNVEIQLGVWQEINNILMEEEPFLNELANAYLEVPEEAKEFLSQATDVIEAEMERLEIENLYSSFFYNRNENYRRMRYGEKVASYLASQMSYSLKLDDLPLGMDPIEYALTESHEGYCMHFASAATLLLRMGGVPARYVSGYAVDSTAFKYNQENDIYTAEVGDFMAHAWVEVYLENIGWVPLEVTPGSSLQNIPTQNDIDRWESLAEAHRQELADKPQPSESEESEESEATEDTQQSSELEPIPSESEEVQNSEAPTPNDSEQNNPTNPGGFGFGEGEISFDTFMKWFGIIGGILLLVVVVPYVIRYGIKRYKNELTNEIEKKLCRKAVKRINRRMYRRLRLCNPKLWLVRKMSDIEYEEALIERYPDRSPEEWKRFMDVVKKNHYSRDEISEEEMLYCYECYKESGCKKRK